MNCIILHRDELPYERNSYLFQGYQYGDTNITFLWLDMPPGTGPELHKHPYEEVFVVQEGQVTFTINSTTLVAEAGHIVIVPQGTPHKFINSGNGPLKQIDIHLSPKFIIEYLEEPLAGP
ncbi:cupin domain-containing protein [Ktedonosporobacter rubrisoli]|uniref:Cupin domain-containing protein n=1 Tax=Ktedonosporobacter rubrisoli TaxID=2509675 RepID=A0A4P6K4K4_KTERU|nr:cupin domain-containing protein [Ktedonosporobacter rubrisoli]QBD82892.1 cupin domain-containing protein [Ktedonosporobacter rubrisoli]